MTALVAADQVELGQIQLAPERRLRLVPPPRRAAASILGLPVDLATEAQLLQSVETAVRTERSTVFVGLYAALFRNLAHDDAYRADVMSSVTYPDGDGVVQEMHRRGAADAQRLATTDVVHPVLARAAAAGWRVGLYGATPGVAERAAERMRAANPGLQIVAVWDGYRPLGERELSAARIDVMLVGMGAARQERWAHEVAVPAGVPAVLTCGGLFDFLAGDKRRAPRWMQRAGLEWAFRVLLEPRRLLVRYLLGNGYFLTATRRERGQLSLA